MQNKCLALLFLVAVLFAVGCGNSATTPSGATTAPAAAAGAPACATSAQVQQLPVQFGDGGSSDTSHYAQGCMNEGICVAGAAATLNPIPVNFSYLQGNGNTPSTLTVSFQYAALFQAEQPEAILFYNNGPIDSYQFTNNYNLSRLDTSFATVCGTINATPAGAGTISYSPKPLQNTPNNKLTTTVIVTFTVTP